MSNLDKYERVFCDVFEINRKQLINLNYQDIPEWDSVGHMALISKLEEVFDVMMETEDIIDFSSFEKGQLILKNKYDVHF